MKFTAALASCALLASGTHGFSAAPSSFVSNSYRASSFRTNRSTKLQSAAAAIPADGSFSNADAGSTTSYGPGASTPSDLCCRQLSMRTTYIMLDLTESLQQSKSASLRSTSSEPSLVCGRYFGVHSSGTRP